MNAYSFLPWLRRGIATGIERSGPDARASVTVQLRVTGEPVSADRPFVQDVARTIQLYGPGDVVGVDRRAIVRTEPRDRSTNFESNFLPFIEFYDEDFPWRYSPTAADDHGRMPPWLAVIVLSDTEFGEGARLPDGPLPFITVGDLAILPPAGQLRAWAHVQVNRSVTADTEVVSEDMDAVLPSLQAVLDENLDLASSRVLCPRRLAPGLAYHAFLVPAFESGRLAGLGLDPAGTPDALHGSWEPYPGRPAPDRLCYYHRWSFRTSPAGDFEQLVRLLKPRAAGPRVGNRDMDVLRPGANLPGITDPALAGVLRVGGALKVPDTNLDDGECEEAQRYEDWDQPYPHPFQRALAALINLSDDYRTQPAADANQNILPDGDPDPLITPPLYGRWHALASRLLTSPDGQQLDVVDNWVHELNLDPRFRVAAGLGAEAVRARQEELMRAAWDQVGEVLEANRRIRAAQLAREVGYVFHATHLEPLRATAPGRALAVTAPLHGRLLAGAVTVAHSVADSRVAAAPLSAVMRRVTRPRARLMRRLPFTAANPARELLERINSGRVTAAPAKAAPTGTITVEQLEAALSSPVPGPLPVLPPASPVGEAARRAAGEAEGGRAAVQDPTDSLPRSPNFRIMTPYVIELGDPPVPGNSDSDIAVRFKAGLRAAYAGFIEADRAGQVPEREGLDLATLGAATMAGLHPDLTVPRRVLASLAIPERLRPRGPDALAEAMAYPVIDVPMYQPLTALSAELFVPNLNQVPPDSITLLETNQRFIEAYLVGVNHEMARELLWREYPTDQRGTPFRQFWDPSTARPRPGESRDGARERLRDIPPLHRWTPTSALGEHDHREAGGDPEDELVLVIRSELLKRYPTAVIYAHRAEWVPGPTPTRRPARLTAAEEADPPAAKVLLPLYEAKVDPEIYFLGFDLTEQDARGGTTPAEDPGWFFVIKERPGEPRFGLDVASAEALEVWNDLAWPDLQRGGGDYIGFDRTRTLTEPAEESEKHAQWSEDRELTWHARMGSADVAYILYQAPVLVAVHAREMLHHAQPEQ